MICLVRNVKAYCQKHDLDPFGIYSDSGYLFVPLQKEELTFLLGIFRRELGVNIVAGM